MSAYEHPRAVVAVATSLMPALRPFPRPVDAVRVLLFAAALISRSNGLDLPIGKMWREACAHLDEVRRLPRLNGDNGVLTEQ